jgi:AcrR family transcriptional regulator
MASAAALFVEKGFEAATMTEIASRAGASIGTLYLFFPTKEALGHAMLVERADQLSARLEALRARAKGLRPAAVADALFGELALVMTAHPVYAILIDLPGDEAWRKALRIKRRGQIAALFAEAKPALPAGQAERLAVILPQFMRMSLSLHGEASLRDAILEELRLMLHRHLDASTAALKKAAKSQK